MSDNSKSPSLSRIPELDGIRGLAICLVLYEHYVGRSIVGTGGVVGVFQNLRILGSSGVELFFVLSGFLIGGILMDHRGASDYFKAFYIRRCCRILPPYLLLLVGFLGFKFFLSPHSSSDWYQQLFLRGGMPFWAYATFTQNLVNGLAHLGFADWFLVTWSLVIEEQFYLCLPLMLWLMRPSTVMKIVLAFTILSPLFLLFLRHYRPGAYDVCDKILPLRGNPLLMGVVCAYVIRRDNLRIWLAQNRRLLNAILILFLLGIVFLACDDSHASLGYQRAFFFYIWPALAYTSLLFLVITNREGPVAAAMRSPLLRRLGVISYGLYLFHLPINSLLHGCLLGRDYACRGPVDVFVTCAALCVTLIFATLSWHFLEKPIVNWGHSFLYGKPAV
jgi:peptidoglycan/LPS O-acetylase OafA/YrhL